MNRQALIVGIDTFGNGDGTPGSKPQSQGGNALPGAVYTADQWYRLLHSRGFACNLLPNTAATRANISAGIDSIYQTSQGQGDMIVLIWCGHGSQVPFLMPDGSIKTYDCLVPYDVLPLDGSANWQQVVRSDEWHLKIARRPPHARMFTNLDVCFSQGLTDARPVGAVRQSIRGPQQARDFTSTFVERFLAGAERELGMAAGLASQNNLVEFSPCSGSQESVEMQFGPHWECLWSKDVIDAAARLPHGTYADIFNFSASKAPLSYPLATPAISGDPALMRKAFLT